MKKRNTTSPKKRWSQNFLTDPNTCRKICETVQQDENSGILEIGPGQGALTRYLVELYDTVWAIEIDPELAEQLPARLEYPKNLQVINRDFLSCTPEELTGYLTNCGGRVIGNLPYHITSPIIFKLLENHQRMTQAVLMVQKEVAERICATPGNKQYGILSVFCQYYAQCEYRLTVPAGQFFPKPQVDSAVIRLEFYRDLPYLAEDKLLFSRIVKTSFNQRRKMLRNTLSAIFEKTILEMLDFDFTRRPETLSVADFVTLTNQLNRYKGAGDS